MTAPRFGSARDEIDVGSAAVHEALAAKHEQCGEQHDRRGGGDLRRHDHADPIAARIKQIYTVPIPNPTILA